MSNKAHRLARRTLQGDSGDAVSLGDSDVEESESVSVEAEDNGDADDEEEPSVNRWVTHEALLLAYLRRVSD